MYIIALLYFVLAAIKFFVCHPLGQPLPLESVIWICQDMIVGNLYLALWLSKVPPKQKHEPVSERGIYVPVDPTFKMLKAAYDAYVSQKTPVDQYIAAYKALLDNAPKQEPLINTYAVDQKIAEAITLAVRYGQFDGSHHKAWVIDQIVRILAGSQYEKIIAGACAGEDGPHTYLWDTGTPP